jgi:hypothetical protein
MTVTAEPVEAPAGGHPADEGSADEGPAAEDRAAERPAEDGTEGSTGESADDEPPSADDFATPAEDAAARSLPFSAVNAYYGTPLGGADVGAFGTGAMAVGTLNLTQVRSSVGFVSSELPEEAVGETVATYVATGTHEKLRERLAARSVVYLSGTPGTGMPTTATVALAQQHGYDQIASVMPLEQSLVHAVGEPGFLLPGRGHVLDLRSGTRLERVHLEALETRAHHSLATVVVLSRSDAQDRELSRYLVRHQRPGHRQVFANWLRHELTKSGRCLGGCAECEQDCHADYVERCLKDPAVTAQLTAAWEVADVVRLAMHCAQEIPVGGEPLRLPEDPAGRRRQASELLDLDWDELGGKRVTQHRQAFRITYALLHGVSISQVFDAVGKLVDALDQAQHRRQTGRSVLELDLDELLGPRMRPETDEAATQAASGTAHRARLRDPRLAEAILDVVWNDYDSLREPLLAWIRELGYHGHTAVRQSVAAATGRLCGYDFEQVRGEVIDGWADQRRAATRQAAALALESAAFNQHLTAKVLRYVRTLPSAPSPYLRDLAARVYATRFGRAFYQYALVDLGGIARDPIQERNDAVAGAVAGIYDQATATEVLATLREWAGVAGPEARHADRCFVMLARRMAEGRDGWPQLLADATPADPTRDTSQQDHLVHLWRSALLSPWTAAGAWEALGYWLNGADRQPEVADPLAGLLAPMLADRPLRQRAQFYVPLWRQWMPGNPFLDRLEKLIHSPGGPA